MRHLHGNDVGSLQMVREGPERRGIFIEVPSAKEAALIAGVVRKVVDGKVRVTEEEICAPRERPGVGK